MNLSEELIISCIYASIEANKVREVYEILKPFFKKPGKLDLFSICMIESLVNQELLKVIQTEEEEIRYRLKQRKRKLEQINRRMNNEPEPFYNTKSIEKFYEDYFRENP